jgi:serine/threonine protein kinase
MNGIGILAIPLIIIGALAIPFVVGIVMYHGTRLLFLLVSRVFGLIGSTIRDAVRLVGNVVGFVVHIPLVMISLLFLKTDKALDQGAKMGRSVLAAAGSVGRLVVGNPLRFFGINVMSDTESSGEEMPMTSPDDLDFEMASSRVPSAPDKFEGYEVVGTLPRGGSGARLFVATPVGSKAQVLAAFAKAPVDKVVIKSFSLEEDSTMPQIVRESRALEAARDLGLVFEHELTGKRFHYVMPYVPGDDLATVTRDLHERAGPEGLDAKGLRAALSYFAELLVTVERFHAKGLWHKDIKPSNVIVSKGRVHLVDLGLVTPLRSAMTLTTHGTEYFRDPEMVRLAMQGVKVHEVDGVKFDLYSAGALLYSMLENSFPAHGSLSRFSRRVPESLQWIVRRSMTDLPKRYGSAVDMLGDLQVVLGSPNPYELRPGDLPSMRGETMSFTGWDAGSADASFRSHGFGDKWDGHLGKLDEQVRKVGGRFDEAGGRIRSGFGHVSGSAKRKMARMEGRMNVKAKHFSERAQEPRKKRGVFGTILVVGIIGMFSLGGLSLIFGARMVESNGPSSWPTAVPPPSAPGSVFSSSTSYSYEAFDENGRVVTVTSTTPLTIPINLASLPATAVAFLNGIELPMSFPGTPVPDETIVQETNKLLAPLHSFGQRDQVLVLNTLPSNFKADGVAYLLNAIQGLDLEIVGLDDDPSDKELEARALSVVGVSGPEDPNAVKRLEAFLAELGDSTEIDAILWLGRGAGDHGIVGQVISGGMSAMK